METGTVSYDHKRGCAVVCVTWRVLGSGCPHAAHCRAAPHMITCFSSGHACRARRTGRNNSTRGLAEGGVTGCGAPLREQRSSRESAHTNSTTRIPGPITHVQSRVWSLHPYLTSNGRNTEQAFCNKRSRRKAGMRQNELHVKLRMQPHGARSRISSHGALAGKAWNTRRVGKRTSRAACLQHDVHHWRQRWAEAAAAPHGTLR